MQEMLTAGVELMLVGMGIVFLFLALLVFTVYAMTWAIQRYFPEPELDTPIRGKESSPAEDDLVAVITSAIHAFRSKR